MRVVALYSIKGGVGKTAGAVNLAWEAMRHGYRTLLWDIDPQGAASWYLRIRPELPGGVDTVLKKRVTRGIKATDYPGLDLLPADFTHRNLDLVLDRRRKRRKSLARVVDRFAADFDMVFVDCPPGISLVSENVFRSADVLLNPVIPSTLSLRTLQQLADFLRESGPRGARLLNYFSMADRRRRMHRDVMETLARERADVLDTAIPDSSVVERMGVERRPVGDFAPRSTAAAAYRRLFEELEAVL